MANSNPGLHLAEQTVRNWFLEQSDKPPRSPESLPPQELPQIGLPVRFLRRFRSSDAEPFQVSVFCVGQQVLYLHVTGTIKVTYARELLTLFQQTNPCGVAEKPRVVLDLTGVNHVAYQARKQVLLAIHVLKNKSQGIWILGSDIVQTLMDMHQKMYPNSTARIFKSASLTEALTAATEFHPALEPLQSTLLMPSRDQLPDTSSSDLRLEQLRALLNSAPDPIFALSLDGKFRDTNVAGQRFFTDILGNTFLPGVSLEAVWPFFSDDEWADVLFDLRKGKSWEGHIHDQNSGRYYQASFTPYDHSGENHGGISLFLRDVTQEKAAEQAARYQQELIDSISYSIQEGLFRSSPQKGIMFVNQAFVEMFGYDSVEEVLALEPYALYVDKKRRDDFVEIVKKRSAFFNEEVQFKRKDGSTFWGLMSSVKKTDANNVIYHDGAIRDVTELREAQEGLEERNAQLMKVNRELDNFVYRVSHDLRAPLVSLLGLISIMRLEDSPEKREKYLGLMEKSIGKLDHFILEIMNYSRNTRVHLHSEEIQLRALVDESIDSLRFSEGSHIHLTNEVPEDLVLHSDPQRLPPILNNLLSNAIRYRDEEKAEQHIAIRAESTDQGVTLSVRDNGIGIAKEHIDKIFDMFYRATRHSEGSGIGLYIVQETVAKLGGRIAVDSAEGQWTEFRVTLPHYPERIAG